MNGADNSNLVGCIGMGLEICSYMKSNGTIKRIYIIDYQFTEGWTSEKDVNGREDIMKNKTRNEQ